MFGWTPEETWGSNITTVQKTLSEGSGVMSGLTAKTRVATSMGWREAGGLAAGDKVMTFDAGLQPVSHVTHLTVWNGATNCPWRFWPLEVPAGALGNRERMVLLPNQGVMVESDEAEELYGDPFSLIPAVALEGFNGIARVPPRAGMAVVLLHFEQDQVVFAESGALFLCPAARDLVANLFESDDEDVYRTLPLDEARALTAVIQADLICDKQMAAA